MTPRRRAALAALGVAAAALLAHGSALWNGFAWDDEAVIVGNPATRDLGALPRVLLSPDERPPYYRPLARGSFLVDHALFGMDPRGFHAVGLALHALAAALLFLLGRRLLKDDALAAAAALLLAVHPIAVEAVSFATARNNLLALVFALVTALAFMRALAPRSPVRPEPVEGRTVSGWALASGGAYLLALLSKEPAAMVLPVLAAWLALPGPAAAPGGEPWARRARLLTPHLAALAIYLALRTAALSGVPAPVDPPPPAIVERLAALGWIVPRYLGLLLWPSGLTVFHAAEPQAGPAGWALAAVGWVALGAVVSIQVRRPTAAGAFGLLWTALTFAPSSGLVVIPAVPVAERFFYLPLAGLALVAADLLARLRLLGRARLVAGAAVAAALLALAARTTLRTADWRDDAALFGSAARVNPGSARAWFNLGVGEKDRGDLAAARRAWEAALALDPGDAATLTQLGTLHAVLGDLAGAEPLLRRALAADPGLAMARRNLALVLERLERHGEADAVRAAAP